MKKYYLFLAAFIFMSLIIHGQTTITLQPDAAAGKDAQILTNYPTMNFGSSNDFDAGMWTAGGNWFTVRSLVQFDLSGIPANSLINSATLSLYFNPNNTSFNNIQYGTNAAYVQRITGSWLESTVVWSTQPAATTQNQASLPTSTTTTQDYPNIDVTALVADMKNNPSFSNGFLLKAQQEINSYRGLIFASSDYSDPTKRPKLVITYTACTPPSAAITAGGSTTFCSGGSVTLNATPTGAAYSYQWVNNGINISGATANSYSANTAGSYVCVVKTTATGCSKPSNAIAVTVNTIPAPTISAGGATAFCTGSSVLLTALPATGVTYQWKLNTNNIAGATLQTYTANASGNYTCSATNSCGTGTSSSITVTIYTTAPAANITASGPTTFCSNSNVTLSSTNTGAGITYQWQKNTVNIAGATLVNYAANQAGSYRCVVTNPCGSSNSNAISVTVNPQPSANISPSGTANICTGASVLLTASSGAGYIYQWKKNGVNISGATSQTYSASQAAGYTVTITSGSCTATSAITTVTVNQALTPTITAQWGGFCGSTTVSLYTNGGVGYSYAWFEDTYPIPNSNNQQLEVGHNGNYSVQVNNGCGTFSSAPYTVTDFVSPWFEPYITIGNSGSLNLCAGGTVQLYINNNTFFNSPTLQWYKDGVAIPGANFSNYTATTGGNYACSVTDWLFWCGWQGPLVFSNWIAVTSTPAAAITPQGSTTFCNGGSVVLSAGAGGGYGYQWKNNNINISGATNQNYTATAAGSYKVVVTNTCGSATSAAVAVTVNALPSAVITPAGPTTFCSGGSVVLNAPVAANRSYQWIKGGNNISGATMSSYTATLGGTYKVRVTNTLTGCSKTGAGVAVTVNSLPSATITPQGPTTFCAGGSVVLSANSGAGLTYKWKKNGVFIGGATQINYTATTAGTYKVQVTNSNGCSKTTASGTVVTVPCREGESLSEMFDVKIFPNPSSGDFVFEIQNGNQDKISIEIIDMVGKIILKKDFYDSEFIIHDTQLSAGVYAAVIVNGVNKSVMRLVKTK